MKKYFYVEVNTPLKNSKILDDTPLVFTNLVRMIKVPLAYKKDFENDLIGSLRDLAGVLK